MQSEYVIRTVSTTKYNNFGKSSKCFFFTLLTATAAVIDKQKKHIMALSNNVFKMPECCQLFAANAAWNICFKGILFFFVFKRKQKNSANAHKLSKYLSLMFSVIQQNVFMCWVCPFCYDREAALVYWWHIVIYVMIGIIV